VALGAVAALLIPRTKTSVEADDETVAIPSLEPSAA